MTTAQLTKELRKWDLDALHELEELVLDAIDNRLADESLKAKGKDIPLEKLQSELKAKWSAKSSK